MSCKICQEPQKLDRWVISVKKKLEANGLCHSCNFWQELIDFPDKNTLIINGTHYQHNGMKDKSIKWRGTSGCHFKAKLLNGSLVETNDLWHQGPIPLRFRDQLPDNAIWSNDDVPKSEVPF